MEPSSEHPDILRKRDAGTPGRGDGRQPGSESYSAEVGDFRQGSPLSQWALGRYLVGRALTESVGNALLVVAWCCSCSPR